jgi:hypothetical protein
MLSEKDIRNSITKSNYYFSNHGDQERQNDNLTILEVEEAALNGRILEYYPDTGRGESCLVAERESQYALYVVKEVKTLL